MIQIRDGVEGKVCSTCREWKPLDKFPIDPTHSASQGGRHCRCKECRKQVAKNGRRTSHRITATVVLVFVICTTSYLHGQTTFRSVSNEPQNIAQALNELQVSLPKWQAKLSGIDVDSLPIRYKQGKQLEFIKSSSLEQLANVEKTAQSLRKLVTAKDAIQLLLNLHDANDLIQSLASAFMVASMDDKLAPQASVMTQDILGTSTDIMSNEKRIEVPVMTLVEARDAMADICAKDIERRGP